MSAVFFPHMTKKIIVAFSDMFNKVYINVARNNGTLTESLVPILFASHEKMIAYLTHLDDTRQKTRITLPAMGFTLTSMDLDEERILNPVYKIMGQTREQYIFQPVPYNYTFDLSVYARYVGTLFDIVESVVAKFQQARNYPFVEFRFIDGSYIQRDLPVVLNATSLNFTTEDVGEEDERIIKTDITFIAKGWVYHSIPNVTVSTSTVPVWSSTRTYAKGEVVSYNGKLYVSKKNNNTNQNPATAGGWWSETTGVDQKAASPLVPAGGASTKLIEWVDLAFEEYINGEIGRLDLLTTIGDKPTGV